MNRIITQGFGPANRVVLQGYGGDYFAPDLGVGGKASAQGVAGLVVAETTLGRVAVIEATGSAESSLTSGRAVVFNTVSGYVLAETIAGAIKTAQARGKVVSIADTKGKIVGIAFADGQAIILEDPSGEAEGDNE